MIERLKRWHAWLRARQAYLWGVLAIFPSLWASSADIQALLPPKVVSWGTVAVAVIAFVLRLRASLKAAKAPDDADKAGA